MRKVRLRVDERSGVERTVAGGLPDRLRENVCHCEPLEPELPREDVMALGETADYFIQNVFNFPTLTEIYKMAPYNEVNKL